MFHARILAKTGKIRMERHARQWHFVGRNTDPNEWLRTAAGRNPIRLHAIQTLWSASESLPAAALRQPGTTYPLLRYHLQKLVEAGVIEEMTHHGDRRYQLRQPPARMTQEATSAMAGVA